MRMVRGPSSKLDRLALQSSPKPPQPSQDCFLSKVASTLRKEPRAASSLGGPQSYPRQGVSTRPRPVWVIRLHDDDQGLDHGPIALVRREPYVLLGESLNLYGKRRPSLTRAALTSVRLAFACASVQAASGPP
jgi:hypothetical protein